jgi:hypothetical protein
MSVGYKLYREVRDFAPADWTAVERLVAWVIADDARDETRRSFIESELIAIRTGLSARGIRAALQRLSERGYEFRVSHGKGSDGREVYAARNHPPDYQVPLIAEIRTAGMTLGTPVDNRPEGGMDRSPS